MLARRNAFLAKKLGMDYDASLLEEEVPNTEVIPATQSTEVAKVEEGTLSDSLKDNQEKMEKMFDIAYEVLESASDSATSLQKSRDFEAFAAILDKATALQNSLVSLKEKRLTKDKDEAKMPHTMNQTNIVISSTRELNNILKGKT